MAPLTAPTPTLAASAPRRPDGLARFPVRTADGGQAGVALRNPAQANLVRNILAAAALVAARRAGMIAPGAHDGRTAVVVGTGPSLDRRENRRAVRRLADKGAVVYALKSAAALLRAAGVRPHYVVNCDALPSQVEKTPAWAGQAYLLASCCDPALFEHVLAAGGRVEVFHSASGAQVTEHGSEVDLYRARFPHDWVAQGGMTVANRAIACAYYHGCARVVLAGCDFGVRDRARFYAAGAAGRMGAGALWVQDDGLTDGRPWYTQPSLIVSAASVAKLILAGFVETVGDSLAAAMARNPRALDRAARGVA